MARAKHGSNVGSQQRRVAARRIAVAMERLGIDARQVSRDTGVNLESVLSLSQKTPHFSTLHRVAQYVEGCARERILAVL